MKTAAIIAEYNPFHNGHMYQIEKLKEKGYRVIVIMSSSFTQRGIPAILDKFTRSKIAVESGTDLVLELPVIFSTSNAEIFAKGAIGILNNIPMIDYLCFGVEDELEILINILEKINSNKKNSDNILKSYLDDGFSFLKAQEMSYTFLNKNEINILKKPNNILAIEYLKVLKSLNSKIKPLAIKRKFVNHNSKTIKNNFSSASNIRNLLEKNDFDQIINLVPKNCYDELLVNKINIQDNYYSIIKFLIISGRVNYSNYVDYEIGLENRLIKNLKEKNINEYINSISTKRYTKSRISRLLIHILLDIKKDLVINSINIPYIRILASNKVGLNLLKELKSNNIYFLDKFSKIKSLDDKNIIKKIAKKEIFATNTYNLILDKKLMQDYLTSPQILL